MKIKERGDEPTAEDMIQRCPVSTTNPTTGKPFDLKLIRKVFSTDCYDLDPENPWRYQTKSKKVFLPDDVVQHRLEMCRWFLSGLCSPPPGSSITSSGEALARPSPPGPTSST